MNPSTNGFPGGPQAEALEAGLARLAAGESLASVLAAYPEGPERRALAALLQTALAVRHTAPVPSPGFRANLQVQLASLDLSVPPDESLLPRPEPGAELDRTARWTTRKGRSTSAEPQPWTNQPSSGWPLARDAWRLLFTRLAATAIALTLFLGGMVAASANSRPGDLLYPVKQAADQVGAMVDSLLNGGAGDDQNQTSSADGASPPGALSPEGFGSKRYVAPVDDGSTSDDSAAGAPPGGDAAAGDAAATETAVAGRSGRPTPTPTKAGAGTTIQIASPTPRPRPSAEATSTATAELPERGQDGPAAPVIVPTLGPLGAIAGRVWGYDRQPRAKWPVAAYPVKYENAEPFGWTPYRTKTAADGTFLLANLPPGMYKVMVGQTWFFWGDIRWYPDAKAAKYGKVVIVRPLATTSGIDVVYERLNLAVPFHLRLRP